MSDFEKQFRELQATARGESTTAGAIRQSVTDEAVQRAIDYFTARKFTIETYLADHDNRESESINTALTALRQMKPTDDAVQAAIDWLEAEKESAQNDWERAGAEWRMEPGAQEQHDERMASFDLAIQALRQMKPSK